MGVSASTIAEAINVDRKSYESYEKEGKLPVKYLDSYTKAFERMTRFSWFVDDENEVNSNLQAAISCLQNYDAKHALLWLYCPKNPEVGNKVVLTDTEKAFAKLLEAKACMNYESRKGDSKAIFSQLKKTCLSGFDAVSASPLETRIFVSVKQIDLIDSYSLENSLDVINEMKYLLRLVSALKNDIGALLYPELQSQVHWNIVNAIVVDPNQNNENTFEHLDALIAHYGKARTRSLLLNDEDVHILLEEEDLCSALKLNMKDKVA
jgi:DNA-binding XRE family transcriptional regulator